MLNVDTYQPSVIVPAAGLSRRFPGWKLGAPFRGEPLLRRALRLAREVSPEVILVLGHRREEAEAIASEAAPVTAVYNPWYEHGLFSSLLTAFPLVTGLGCYVLLPDLPLLEARHFRALPLGHGVDAARPFYRGRPGHPVYLGQRVIERALSYPLASRMQDVISRYTLAQVDVDDPAVVTDVDSELDYLRLLSHAERI